VRTPVRFFVSYAHQNQALASQLLDKLQQVLAPSKRFEYQLWSDHQLRVGEDWQQQIAKARDACDFGLLLVSPAFLASKFITEHELPTFVTGVKPAIPVMLQPVDFERHDLKGLAAAQIFRLHYPGLQQPRAYGECKGPRRDSFAFSLFQAIETRLAP